MPPASAVFLLINTIGRFLEEHAGQSDLPVRRTFSRIIDHLEQHYNEDLTLEKLALDSRYSVRSLTAQFKQCKKTVIEASCIAFASKSVLLSVLHRHESITGNRAVGRVPIIFHFFNKVFKSTNRTDPLPSIVPLSSTPYAPVL